MPSEIQRICAKVWLRSNIKSKSSAPGNSREVKYEQSLKICVLVATIIVSSSAVILTSSSQISIGPLTR